MYTTEDKYQPLSIEVEERPTIFVGMNPGKTRKGKYSPYVWDGDTKTSNLLREAVEGYTNIVLTNVCNYQNVTISREMEGINDLIRLMRDLEPKKVICLGDYAYKTVTKLYIDLMLPDFGILNIKKFHHPSYIVRFQKDREEYINNIRKELE